MPTIAKGKKVLVSGSNGYIAMWVTRQLLERGYTVRGTVRTEKKADFMNQYFTSLGYGDKLELVIVDDIVKDGAFDEAVKGVDAIEHTASPFHTDVKDPQELIVPAVQGTVGMLKSALKYGTQVKRIVVTSSCAAISSPYVDKPTVLSERDWDSVATKEVEEKGLNANPMAIYRASKTLAEKGAWEFYEKHKADIEWDLVVINPPFVFGPPIHEVPTPRSLNTSMKTWYDMVVADKTKTKQELAGSDSWVDVRDVALGHALALEKSEAAGERIITTGGGYIWQEWLDAANSFPPEPSLLPTHKLPRGFPEILQGEQYRITYDKSKEERILGIKFHTKAETTKDSLEDFAKRGW